MRLIRTTRWRGSGIRPAPRCRERCEALGVTAGPVAAIGGPHVYSLFLHLGYDAFHLCRAVDVHVPGGLPLFVRDRFGGEPDACLRGAGLTPGPTIALGGGVTLTDWTRD